MKPTLLGAVLESFGILAAEADLVLVEGAGSASEVNLRASDIANMGFARAAEVPVVRKATRPTKASRERRLEGKNVRAQVKAGRAKIVV